MLVLKILNGYHAGLEHVVQSATVTLGRAEGNDLVLTDQYVSGEHLRITCDDGDFLLRDLRSTNGSTLQRGDKQITIDDSLGWQVVLEDGDHILLGDLTEPVRMAISIPEQAEESDEEQIIAIKRIADAATMAAQAQRDPQRLAALYRATAALGHHVDQSQVVSSLGEAVFELIPGATHVTVALADEANQMVPVLTRARDDKGKVGDPVSVSRSLLRKVQRERATVQLANASETIGSKSVFSANILSALGVPLWAGDEVLGILQVDNRASAGIFTDADMELLTVFAGQAALAIHGARLYQRLEAAEAIQRRENRFLKRKEADRRMPAVIGDSAAMRKVFDLVEKVKDTRVSAAIEGETGTGKELIASMIHYGGNRRDKLFVAQNCAALTENLLESELFGHKRGAFTGASADKKGLFELAHNGTIFLDEIGEMSLGLQAKVLRVLQDGEIRPLGSTEVIRVDARVVSATNKDLAKMVAEGKFREDLYYRLHVFPIRVPPLRERREDIPALTNFFVERYARELNREIGGVSQEAMDYLVGYSWPGNVRELENEVQRIVLQADDGAIVGPDLLSERVRKEESVLERLGPNEGTLKDRMGRIETWILTEALRKHKGNKSATARKLGITREGLHKKLTRFGVA